MERCILIKDDEKNEVNGQITIDLPSRKDRLEILKKSKLSEGSASAEGVLVIEEEVASRVKKVNLTVNESALEGFSEEDVKSMSKISSYDELQHSPICDLVMNYITQVVVSGRLGKLRPEESETKPSVS